MARNLPFLAIAVASVFAAPIAPSRAAEGKAGARYVDPDAAAGTSAAVVVPPDAALAHTSLLLPVDIENRVTGGGDAAAQADQVLQNIQHALAAASSDLSQAVRLNVYAADRASLTAARQQVAKALPRSARPAATWIVTQQPREGVLVTMDAVAVCPIRDRQRVLHLRSDHLPTPHSLSHVTVMPPGEIFFISGQLEKGESLAEGVRNTMAGLHRTLEHFGLDPAEQVVQVKAFIHPMDQSEEALREIADSYSGASAPAVVITEWQAAIPGPTEIEMIAVRPGSAAPPTDKPAAAVRFVAPPWLSTSPVFSRIAVVDSAASGGLVYFSGITGAAELPAEEQAAQVFETLERLCEKTGSDFQHLVKATYYASHADVSPALRAVRPKYYNTERPPAASLVHVRGVGTEEGIYTLDMIGVSVP